MALPSPRASLPLHLSTALLVARCALAAVFLAAAALKLAQPQRFRRALADLGAPSRFIGFLSWAVPALEAGLAVVLLIDATAPGAAVAAMAVLATFSVVTGRALRRGERIDCGCFSSASSPISQATLMRNAGVIALAVPVAVAGSGEPLGSIDLPLAAGFMTAVVIAPLVVYGAVTLGQRRRSLRQTRSIQAGLARALASGESPGSG